jgi:ubiquitin carboxyl-terminal hydrolase L3
MARTYKRAIKPWESSSEVFTDGAHELGLSKELHFEDVLELAGPLPERTVALILTYTTPADYERRREKDGDIRKTTAGAEDQGPDVIWLSQDVQNACGPYALFHAIFNSNGRNHLGKLVGVSMFKNLV